MITLMTSCRFKGAMEMYEIENKLRCMRSSPCFDESDVNKIDKVISLMDGLINKVMRV